MLGMAPPAMVGEVGDWELALMFMALPLLGGILGNLQFGKRAGSPRRQGARKRMLFLGLWIAVVSLLGLPHALAGRLNFIGDGTEMTLAVLMINFWIGESLSLHPYNPLVHTGGRSQWQQFFETLRMPAPILVLILLGLALPWAMGGGDSLGMEISLQSWLKSFAGMTAMMVFVLMVAMPLMIRYCWGLRPLPNPETERTILDELRANGVTVARVLAWPDEMTGSATAGVIGLLPNLRYLLFSPALADVLDEGEIRSVTAHEAGHIKNHHLWFFFLGMFGLILLVQVMQVLTVWMNWDGLLSGDLLPLLVIAVAPFAFLLLSLRYGFGYLSREFERQADGNAFRSTGTPSFQSAIEKVARINGIPVEMDNWHHHGIAKRIAYLREAGANPATIDIHDRRVRRIKLGLAGFLLLMIALHGAVLSPYAAEFFGEGNPGVLIQLASGAHQRNDLDAAERYYRMFLDLKPDHAVVQNNLAWVLVTRPGQDAYGLEEGLSLALSASSASREAFIWDTLAESYDRLNRRAQAIAAAEEALALAEGGKGRGDAPLKYYRDRVQEFSR